MPEKSKPEAALSRLQLAELQAERARVVMESLAGFCHALGQPATVLLSSVELLRLPGVDAETQKQVLDMCYDAVIEIRNLLAEMKQRREYVAEAYLAGNNAAGQMISLPEWSANSPAGPEAERQPAPKASWER